MTSSSRSPKSRFVLLQVVVVGALCAFGGYQQLFSTFAAYDDEGYMMLSLEGFQRAGGLYEQVYSQYGPAYYVLQSAFHRLLDLPITHDVSRMRTLMCWTLACLLASLALQRMIKNRLFSTLAFVVMFQHLDRLALEPGHPQEWCAVLLAASWLIGTYVIQANKGVSNFAVVLLGICCATVTMIKINLGVFLGLAILISLINLLPATLTQRRLRIVVSGAICMLPWAIGRPQIGDAAAMRLMLIVFASALMVLVRYHHDELHNVISWRALGYFFVAATGTGLFFAACALWTGTTFKGLLHGLVLQHVAFGDRAFYRPAPLPQWSSWWVLVMLVLFLLEQRTRNLDRWLRPFIATLLIATAITQMFDACRPLEHGIDDRSLAAWWMTLFAPAAWIVLPRRQCSGSVLFLAITAVLQPLGAYPVPGTQMAIGSWLLLGLGWYGLHLALEDHKQLSQTMVARIRSAAPRQVAFAMLLLVVASLIVRDSIVLWRRQHYTALNLPGTYGLRLPDNQVRELHWIVAELQQKSDTFVFRAHTRGSFYYWTKRPPPTWHNATCWPYLLDNSQQQVIIRALARYARVCAVDEPYSAPLPVNTSPLLRYIDRHFMPVSWCSNSNFRIAERRVPGAEE